MLENKKTYVWFAALTTLFGLMVFLVSLVSAISMTKMDIHEKNRTLYFDRKILPDHLLYPVLVAVDRLELEVSDPEERIVLEMDYANKRLEAAKALFEREKVELAFVTLGKAHQYLLRANESVVNSVSKARFLSFLVGLNQKFDTEYEMLKIYMDDSQRSRTDAMVEELKAVGGKL